MWPPANLDGSKEGSGWVKSSSYVDRWVSYNTGEGREEKTLEFHSYTETVCPRLTASGISPALGEKCLPPQSGPCVYK